MTDDRTHATPPGLPPPRPSASGRTSAHPSGRLGASGSGEWSRKYRVGDRLGDYVLVRELGEGGMGSVFVARHVTTGAEVALKVMLVDPDVNAGALERFRREGQAQAAGGKHPNVLVVHSAGEEAGFAFIVMELARGGDLKARLKQGPLEPRVAAALVAGLARGLAHVHAHGVLHRDLKPGNVVFGDDGTPKLMDFGLAQLAGSDKLTKTGTMLGTPSYMAPEQAAGEPLDERADVYALGAVLYHCLVGRPPFDGDSMYVVVRKVLTQAPTPPRQVSPDVPLALEQLVLRALAKDPAQRFQTAAALADELDTFLRGELVAKPPTARRVALGLGLAAALGVLALGAAFARGRPTPSPSAPAAVTTDVAPVASAARPQETTIVSPPLADDGEDESLREWSIVDHAVDRLEVVATARTESIELRVEHVDAQRAVGPQQRARARTETLAVGELRVDVALAVGWTSITLVRVPEGRVLARREVVRLPARILERTGRTSVRANVDGSLLRLVPPGRIVNRQVPPDDTRPRTAEVTAPFLLGVHEVSWRQFRAYRQAVPGPLPAPREEYLPPYADTDRDDQPVNYASMFDAYGYCDWAGLRLPEDLEWERAAAGQTAWNGAGEPFKTSCPVDDTTIAGARGTWGHWHLIGNLAEWVQAVYYRDGASDVRRSGIFGGAFYGDPYPPPKYAQYDPHDQMADTGFRVAHSAASDRGHFFKFE